LAGPRVAGLEETRPGAPVAAAQQAPEPPLTVADGQPVMPHLAGLSLRQALEALAPFGVRLEITGRGVVTGQAPAPGAPLPAGAVCRIHLAPVAGRPAAAVATSFQP
ncbi:MAG TPA: PASTA domain-containing protein, partial [Methylomirabilota bacterium]|nr:PASTA domain-containing protein [Methylomirabilota bacterium]